MAPTLRLLAVVAALVPGLGATAVPFSPGSVVPALGPPAAGALAALEAGDPAKARVLLAAAPPPAPDQAVARLILEARIHEALADWEAAAGRWSEAARADAKAAPWLAGRAVEAALAAEDAPRARALLQAIPEGHPVEASARVAVARSLAESDAPGEALQVLEAGRDRLGARQGEAWVLEATVRERVGQKAQAAVLWRRIYLESPLARGAGAAEARLRALGAGVPDPVARVERLEALLAGNRSEAVTGEAPEVLSGLEPGSAPWCRVLYAEGKAWRMRRAHAEAVTRLRPVAERCPEPRLKVRALYLLASSLSISEGDAAIPVYEALAARFPTHSFADDALFYVADLHRRAGRRSAALATLDRQVAAWPQGDFHAEALWRGFWIHWEAGEGAQGLTYLDRLVQAHGEEPFERSRALYWKARVAEGTPKGEAAAVALYARVFREHPLSYYGALALARLRARDPARTEAEIRRLPPRPDTPPDARLEVDPAFLAHPAVAEAIHLLALGLPEEGGRVLRGAWEAARGDDETMALALLFEAAGDPARAHRLLRTRVEAFQGAWPAGDRWRVWRAAWPLAFRGLVEQATREFQVPTDLLQALIREESALDPEVVSWAGAVGLAQLMPATAADLARRVGLPSPPSRAQLTDPALNLRLSARYLADLLRSTGHPALAIASYNGGPGSVRRWLKERGDLELDAFVETMGYAETRGYTRRVLRSWVTYQYLYGSPEARFVSLPLGLSP